MLEMVVTTARAYQVPTIRSKLPDDVTGVFAHHLPPAQI
jgi:hypothetical protein